MTRARRVLLIPSLAALVAVLVLGCELEPRPAWCEVAPNKPVLDTRAFVVNGTTTPTEVPLEPLEVRAVIAVSTAPRGSHCSGVLVAPDVVVTARHCTAGVDATRLLVLVGEDDTRPLAAIAVASKHEHEVRDVAVLVLDEPATDRVEVTPVPVDDFDLLPADVGAAVEQAGYGRTESGEKDGRRFVVERLDSLEGPYLVVDGRGEAGVCAGDSGGPSLRVNPAGEVRVIGVLSWGDSSCTDRDRYTRLDLVRPFLDDHGAAASASVGGPCPAADDAGACSADRARATRCEGGARHVEVCSAGTLCDVVDGRAACVAPGARACGQETAFGRCQGERLVFCDERSGALSARDCGACEEMCALVDGVIGYACVPSACGGLDARGQCAGVVAQWCAGGVVRERDCGSEGLVCSDADPLMVDCAPDPTCEELGYLGRCDGDVAVWCSEDGRRSERDCAEYDQTCGYVSASTGYYCIE